MTNKSEKYLINHMPDLDQGYCWSNFSKANKYILSPNEDKVLLELKGELDDITFIKNRDKIRKHLKDIQVEISYTGIYKESCKEHLGFKLDWYGRHSIS